MTPPLLDALDGTPDDSLVRSIEAMLRIEQPTALARATGLMLWKRAWEAVHGKQRGGDRKSPAYTDKIKPKSFRFDAAERLGLSERAIELDVALAESLGAGDIRRLWNTKIADNAAALRTVATLPRDGRDALFKAMRANPDASWATYLEDAGLKAQRDSADDLFNRLYDLWSEANASVRRRFLKQIGATMDKGRAV